mmetsp:Transcript_12056/g.26832  ORF Transcript_12056/g.26832 Transcript_12056/m.26832 type:complete len:910 (-) Transcript_12056:442-3171(-)
MQARVTARSLAAIVSKVLGSIVGDADVDALHKFFATNEVDRKVVEEAQSNGDGSDKGFAKALQDHLADHLVAFALASQATAERHSQIARRWDRWLCKQFAGRMSRLPKALRDSGKGSEAGSTVSDLPDTAQGWEDEKRELLRKFRALRRQRDDLASQLESASRREETSQSIVSERPEQVDADTSRLETECQSLRTALATAESEVVAARHAPPRALDPALSPRQPIETNDTQRRVQLEEILAQLQLQYATEIENAESRLSEAQAAAASTKAQVVHHESRASACLDELHMQRVVHNEELADAVTHRTEVEERLGALQKSFRRFEADQEASDSERLAAQTRLSEEVAGRKATQEQLAGCLRELHSISVAHARLSMARAEQTRSILELDCTLEVSPGDDFTGATASRSAEELTSSGGDYKRSAVKRIDTSMSQSCTRDVESAIHPRTPLVTVAAGSARSPHGLRTSTSPGPSSARTAWESVNFGSPNCSPSRRPDFAGRQPEHTSPAGAEPRRRSSSPVRMGGRTPPVFRHVPVPSTASRSQVQGPLRPELRRYASAHPRAQPLPQQSSLPTVCALFCGQTPLQVPTSPQGVHLPPPTYAGATHVVTRVAPAPWAWAPRPPAALPLQRRPASFSPPQRQASTEGHRSPGWRVAPLAISPPGTVPTSVRAVRTPSPAVHRSPGAGGLVVRAADAPGATGNEVRFSAGAGGLERPTGDVGRAAAGGLRRAGEFIPAVLTSVRGVRTPSPAVQRLDGAAGSVRAADAPGARGWAAGARNSGRPPAGDPGNRAAGHEGSGSGRIGELVPTEVQLDLCASTSTDRVAGSITPAPPLSTFSYRVAGAAMQDPPGGLPWPPSPDHGVGHGLPLSPHGRPLQFSALQSDSPPAASAQPRVADAESGVWAPSAVHTGLDGSG